MVGQWQVNLGAGIPNCFVYGSGSRSFVASLPPISALEVTGTQVFYFRAVVTSSAGMNAKTPLAKLLDKTIWNPRPGICLLTYCTNTNSTAGLLGVGVLEGGRYISRPDSRCAPGGRQDLRRRTEV
jgi:hypothetical protein